MDELIVSSATVIEERCTKQTLPFGVTGKTSPYRFGPGSMLGKAQKEHGPASFLVPAPRLIGEDPFSFTTAWVETSGSSLASKVMVPLSLRI
jgi:hypothetical protein